MEELSARLRALGRRMREYKVRSLSFGNIELDMESSELRSLNTIGLAHKEVLLLSCLLSNTDRELTSQELIDAVWNRENADSGTVWIYISFLKAKLQSVQANVTIEGDRDHSYRLKKI